MGSGVVRVGQIGFGYWGPNLLRNLASIDEARVLAVAEIHAQRRADAARAQPDLDILDDHTALLARPDIDAVVISTPAASHASLATAALEAGKDVLVEKPLALNTDDGQRLVDLAEKHGRILMVGHTFLYNAAVRRLKRYITDGELGDVLYLYSQRLNLGRIRQDVNALWNFGPHDVSIARHLIDASPVEVSARGFAYLQKNVEDVVFLTMVFADRRAAHMHISWLDPHKVRTTTVVGSKKMAVYDDVSSDARIVLYDRGVERLPTSESPRDFADFAEFQLRLRRGDVTIPALSFPEPLHVECQHFIECVQTRTRPITDGREGLAVVRVLEAAQRSMSLGGQAVPVESA